MYEGFMNLQYLFDKGPCFSFERTLFSVRILNIVFLTRQIL